MGRLNYTNRKSEGLKLGQVIAKDLLKRIRPGSGHKAALRDPYVEIDVSGRALTDEGLLETANALTTSAVFDDEHGKVVILEELGLKANQLTAGSLWALSKVVALAAHDLRDLDLSDNLISVGTTEETAAWEAFLESFSGCCVLRRIDFSGNPLGPRAFEVLARVYGKEDPVELLSISDIALNGDDLSGDFTSATGSSTILERPMRRMSIVSDDLTSDLEVSSNTAGHRRKFSRQDAQSPDKQMSTNAPEKPFPVYASTRGLRSVPYIVFGNTTMTEACALHLSYVLVCHNFPEQLVARVPPAKAGPPQHQLESYGITSGCKGMVYLPNDKLGTAGSRVLELAELARTEMLDDASQDEPDEEFKTPTKSPSALRKVSDVQSSPSFSATSGRRRSATSATGSEHGGRNASSGNASNELDRARSRIQGNILRDFGVSSVDLWRISLRMLTSSRAILLLAAEVIRHEHVKATEPRRLVHSPPPPQPARPAQLVQPVRPLFQTQPVDDAFPPLPSSAMRAGVAPLKHSKPTPLRAGNPNHPATPTGHLRRRKRSVNPNTHPSSFESLTSADTDTDTNTGAYSAPEAKFEQQPYRSRLPHGFSENVWMQIISHMAGADGIVNITQQRSILRWAMDRTTLSRGREALGKPEGAQIWRLLEGIGCLAYDVRARREG
ncbi:hypothetical protein LPUS_01823 [Lasallia pustulata]|uniref:Uncharacterized protein n=1 Tax=Lasallia pustulata TaxID=136370 RepID=A0A1W5CRS1_9LECA|nr:hypothetical protein LPUS_01823 [Lasallia pustulata]